MLFNIDFNSNNLFSSKSPEYYTQHIDELVDTLIHDMTFTIMTLGSISKGAWEGGNKEDKKKAKKIFNDDDMLIDTFINAYRDYFTILKKNAPEKYSFVIESIAEVIKNKDNLSHMVIDALLTAKKSSRTTAALVPMFDGKATQALGRARSNGKLEPLSGKLKITNGVNIFMPDSVHKIGVGTAKIFRYIVSEFTKRNASNEQSGKLKLRFFIDAKEYARLNGVDTNSDDAMKNFRRKIKIELHTLKQCGPEWTEVVKGKERPYGGMNYIGKYEVNGDTVEIEFTLTMGEYLVLLPLLQYPYSLYRLPDREFNAFAIGEAMCLHYSQDNNVIRGTEGKLKVETLLSYTSFPKFGEIKEKKLSWEQKVKEPFERALDILYQCGFLKDYSLCYEGGVEISDEAVIAGAIDSYEKFISLIVKFELNDFEEHEVRAKAIAEKKAAQIEKMKSRRKRKENPDSNTTDK